MKNLTRKILAAIVIVSLCALSGCNTFKGMGEDIESLGESIQGAGE